MLYYRSENIVNTECQAIIHGCNCKGKMASGVALAIRNAFPEAYEEYMQHFGRGLGSMIVARSGSKIIGNLLTQQNYGYDEKPYASSLAIKLAIDSFCFYYRGITQSLFQDSFPPIASPKIGCGLGGLHWKDIQPIYEELSNYHKIDFFIYDNNNEVVK